MERPHDVYGYAERLRRKLRNIQDMTEISPHNRRKMFSFYKSCLADGLSPARTLRYLNDLPILAKYLGKDFEEATREDIEDVMAKIEASDYAGQTKLGFKVTTKKFYKWMNGGEEYPEAVKWIKTSEKHNNHKMPEDLFSEVEVKKMIEACLHSRDRAIIAVLWETGCRVGEILTLQLKHVTFEKALTRITLQGKTGMRRVPVFDSTPYLAEWIGNHPMKDDPSAPLWVGIGTVGRGRHLEYAALRKMLIDIARKAGIKKDVNPHNFRHSRATFMANHLKEAQLTQYFGWVQGSDVPSVYVHLSGRDVDDAILRMRGIKPEEEKETQNTLAPKQCIRCGLTNKATGSYCTRCGAALDLKTAIEINEQAKELDNKFATLLENKDVQDFLVKKMIEMKIK